MKSAKAALDRYYQRQLDEQKGGTSSKRKNAKPEFEVKKAVMKWLRANGFAVNSIEAKAVYSFESGRYLRGQTDAGVSDILGCGPDGVSVAIELKAPGRRSTLKPHQRAFLMDRIERGAFAVCVDSVECLERAWREFEHRRKMEPQLGKALLYRHLPPETKDASLNFEKEIL